MNEQLRAFWKKLLSYTKANWNVVDYPLRYRKQIDTSGQYNVGELKPWVVQIINWWAMTGLGDTKQEAFEHLKSNFNGYLEHNPAPRPGTSVQLSFANTSQIEKLEDVAPDFFEKTLDLNYYECFISDESSLIDFGRGDDETLQKINTAYGLGLTDLGDGNIVRLLTLIKHKALE
jgi:hypothetical protein